MKNINLFRFKSVIIRIALLLMLCSMSCTNRDPKVKPELMRVSSRSDLSRILGINIDKYEYDLSGLTVPADHLVYHTIWMDLFQGNEKVQTWTTPNITCGNSGSILLAYYTPPLFSNEEDAIEAKIIVIAAQGGEHTLRISPNRPFRRVGWFSKLSKKTIEVDREYTLSTICEEYSPLSKSSFGSDMTDIQSTSENKALVLKVKFGLFQDKQK